MIKFVKIGESIFNDFFTSYAIIIYGANMINYSPFFNTIKSKKISQNTLSNNFYVSKNTINKMRNNQSVSLKTIEYLCKILDCSVNEIVSINN